MSAIAALLNLIGEPAAIAAVLSAIAGSVTALFRSSKPAALQRQRERQLRNDPRVIAILREDAQLREVLTNKEIDPEYLVEILRQASSQEADTPK